MSRELETLLVAAQIADTMDKEVEKHLEQKVLYDASSNEEGEALSYRRDKVFILEDGTVIGLRIKNYHLSVLGRIEFKPSNIIEVPRVEEEEKKV